MLGSSGKRTAGAGAQAFGPHRNGAAGGPKGEQRTEEAIPAHSCGACRTAHHIRGLGRGEADYAHIYRTQGKRPNRRQPPGNPLLYVPYNSATMLKRDLEAAGIPIGTEEGRLDFHALRTAYINFLIELGANVKTIQELARHATVATTLNLYGRTRSDKKREVVDALGIMLLGNSACHNELCHCSLLEA